MWWRLASPPTYRPCGPHPARCKAAEKNVDSAGASLPPSRRFFAANLRTAVGHGDRLLGMAGHFARLSLPHRKGIRNPCYCVHGVVRHRGLPAWRLFDSPGPLLALAASVAPQRRHFSLWLSRCFSGRCRFRCSLPRFRLDHGRLRRPRLRLGNCHWSARLLCCRLRLRQTFQSALERNLHQPGCHPDWRRSAGNPAASVAALRVALRTGRLSSPDAFVAQASEARLPHLDICSLLFRWKILSRISSRRLGPRLLGTAFHIPMVVCFSVSAAPDSLPVAGHARRSSFSQHKPSSAAQVGSERPELIRLDGHLPTIADFLRNPPIAAWWAQPPVISDSLREALGCT